MKKSSVKKIMILDRRTGREYSPVFLQLMTKSKDFFKDNEAEYIRVACHEENPAAVTKAVMAAVAEENPDLLLIGADSIGEEVAPELGVKLRTGVAAHCIDITEDVQGRVAYMVPAFGGRVIGEIFIPNTKPAIATVKPGIFLGSEESAGEFRTFELPADGGNAEGFAIIGREERKVVENPIDKAEIIFCGGFGIGSGDTWKKIEKLATALGGAAGCTRPVVDMEWCGDESHMIGTSGKTVRPKIYVGFGISGAAHHICGIKDSDVIISINNDKDAEVFKASDYAGVFDANSVIDKLLEVIN